MMVDDPKRLVAEGYDKIARRYLEWCGPSPARMRYLHKMLELLPPGSNILELGCGAGVPCTRMLAERYHVTGVDSSAAQISLAREHVPGATFFHADMTMLAIPPEAFDAVVAFYSLIHIPRSEHARLLCRIASWLRPGGWLLATMGTENTPGVIEADWLGAPMYWSSYDAETNRELVRHTGFTPLESEVLTDEEDGEPTPFLWMLARKGELPLLRAE